MLNRTIFKQSMKANFKLWFIITAVLSFFNTMIVAVFDPDTISSVTDLIKDTPFAGMLTNTTFLGMLSQSFYTMHGIILPLIFIIITASSLVVSQVDRGSMAYVLSTPTKRSVVARTQAVYFVTALLGMFVILTGVGLVAIQAFHGGVWAQGYTEDVKAASEVLGRKEGEVAADLTLILKDEEALDAGAKARGMDQASYRVYLNLKMTEQAYEAAAEILGVEAEEVSSDPAIIKNHEKALSAAAEVMGMDPASYRVYLDRLMAEKTASAQQAEALQDQILKGVTAAAAVLGVDASDLLSDMGQIKLSSEALDAAVQAAGLPQEVFVTIINNQIASNALAADKGIDFKLDDFLMINLGLFLLMFATSGISFMFSCIFNLTKNYMALGGGLPIAFFLFQMMAQVSESLEKMKYLTINSLFDTQAILDGGNYLLKFGALAAIGAVLYLIGMRVFEKKDLPL